VGCVPALTSIGLSPSADLTYRYLAGVGGQRVADISRTLGIPPRRVRLALDELADVGAAATVAQPGRPVNSVRLWQAAGSERVAAEVRHRRQQLAIAGHALRQLLARPAELGISITASGTRPIGSLAMARNRLVELVAVERHEHLVMNPDMAFSPDEVRIAAPASQLIRRRGIEIRDLGVPPAPDDATGELVADLAAGGAQFRVLPSVPAKMMIFDRSTALIRLDRGFLEITDAPIVAGLVELFLTRWDRAAEYKVRDVMDLTARERAAIELLAAGLTDTAIAEELGVSIRTVAYTMRDLMSRFEVRNRFQLGLALAPYLRADT
jgi:DNA-binding CsgD family transcriptional regulator